MSSPPPIRLVKLIDLGVEGQPYVTAEVHRDCPPNTLDRVEAEWAGARRIVAESRTNSLEHSHWDWRNKSETVAAGHHRLIVVECNSQVQGIMAVLRVPKPARLGAGQVLYVDFLEVAPWNLRGGARPRFGGVGTVLIAEAVLVASEMGLAGHVGLHSLQQAEAFYTRCLMTAVGPDPDYNDLMYFEYNARQVVQFEAATARYR